MIVQIQADAICRRTCSFCSIKTLEPGARNMTFAEIRANLEYFSERGMTEVIIASGEPTDRPDFEDILVLLGTFDLERVTMVSRGYKWQEEAVFHLIKNLPLVVVFSFDVWSASSLDLDSETSLAGKVTRTIAALRAADVPVQSNTVLDRNFLSFMPDIVDVIAQLDVVYSILTFPFPKGGVLEDPDTHLPTLEGVLSALEYADQTFGSLGRAYGIKGLPICYVSQYREHLSKTKNRLYITSAHQFDKALEYIPDRLYFHKDDVCDTCSASEQCDGFWEYYLDRKGFPPLAPLNT